MEVTEKNKIMEVTENVQTVLDANKNYIKTKNPKIVNLTAIIVDVLHETINGDNNIKYTNCMLKFLTGKPVDNYIIGFVEHKNYNVIETDMLVTVQIKYDSKNVGDVKFFIRHKKIHCPQTTLISERTLIESYR